MDASVAVAKIGIGGDLDTTNLEKAIVSLIWDSNGLIADATLEGSRLEKPDVKDRRGIPGTGARPLAGAERICLVHFERVAIGCCVILALVVQPSHQQRD